MTRDPRARAQAPGVPARSLGQLGPREREAVELARDLQRQVEDWMLRHGVSAAPMLISPFIAPDGQPNVLIRANTRMARALLLSLDQERAQPPFPPRYQRRDDGGLSWPVT